MIIAPASTDVTTYFHLVHPTTFVPVTGLTITDLDATYIRDRAAAVKADLTALAAVDSAHGDNKAIQIDATNAPGVYRVDWPDAAFIAGVSRVHLVVNGAAIAPTVIEVELSPTGDVADAVWDEVLTVAGHDVAYSAGQRLRLQVLRQGVATGGGPSTITLALVESATDHLFNENIVSIVAGVGVGQTRLIAEYNGATKVATVDKAWFVEPIAGSTYEILPFSSILLAQHGIATGGAASSITLSATASAIANSYVGSVIYISTGTGFGQVRLITAYDSVTKIATVSDAWTTTPDTSSVYKLIPTGRVVVDTLSAGASAQIWASPTRTLTQSAASVTAAVAGSTISIARGDTVSIALTGLGDLTGNSKIWFTAKSSYSDDDAEAIIQVEKTLGLAYLNGAAAVTATDASLVVDVLLTGNITITLKPALTSVLEPVIGLYYDIQMLGGDGHIHTLTTGSCNVIGTADITRAIT
jgi:hypothetical protein